MVDNRTSLCATCKGTGKVFTMWDKPGGVGNSWCPCPDCGLAHGGEPHYDPGRRDQAEINVIAVRGSWDVPGFEACVDAEMDRLKKTSLCPNCGGSGYAEPDKPCTFCRTKISHENTRNDPDRIEAMARASYDVKRDEGNSRTRYFDRTWDDLSTDRQALEIKKVMAMLEVLHRRS